MNRKFVSKSNRVLRKVLNSKENLDVIQDIIEAFLPVKIKQIRLNPYLKAKAKNLPAEENFGIADVRAYLENGEELNIGIQFIDGYYVQNKMLLYYAQIHTNQLAYKENQRIAKTVTLNFLDFTYLKSKQYLNKITIPSEEGKIELYVIELPKFSFHQSKTLNKQMAWMSYLCGGDWQFLESFEKIKKLDNLLEQYWKEEKME